MSDDRMHHVTVRINKDSYVGRKVLEALEQMKRSTGLSYNACFQESILLMHESTQKQFSQASAEQIKNSGQLVTEKVANKTSVEKEISAEEMYALVGDSFSQDYS